MEELRECPFCSSENLRRDKPNNFMPEYIHCEDCGGMNGVVGWNTRATDPLLDEMARAFEVLAKLGNGDRYGNSIGNTIALEALQKYREATCQQEKK